MYCAVFGIPRGVFTITRSAFMAHPIFNPEKEKPVREKEGSGTKKDSSKAVEQAKKQQQPSGQIKSKHGAFSSA